jgi:hypothetical protein
MNIMKNFLLIALFFFNYYQVSGQTKTKIRLFKDVVIQTDSGTFSKSSNMIQIDDQGKIWFNYFKEDEACRIMLFPDSSSHFKTVSLLESGDFDIIDSLRNYNNQYYDFKLRFKHLTKSDFLKFTIIYSFDSVKFYHDINLFPIFKTTARLNSKTNELTVGEEKVIELITNNPENIILNPDWNNSQEINYRILENNGHLYVHLISNSLGQESLSIKLKVYKPALAENKLVYTIGTLNYTFNVKSAGLIFLQTDKTEILFDDKSTKDGVNVQIDNARNLQLNRTYMIEAQESPGSPLIATLYVRERLANNKVTGILHIYNLHRQSEGYLYIKDNDEPRFITNLNIIPKTSIERIRIMRNGKDWIDENSVYPGETVNVRLEGQSLSKAKFNFDPLIEMANDSFIKNDNFIEYKLKVPINIHKSSIAIFNYNQSTGKSLNIKEYQNARAFDYIYIGLEGTMKNVTGFHGPEFYKGNLRDIIISFKPEKIESDNKLYGKQYFDIDVKVYDKEGELKDFATISDQVVCPGENSPRYAYYDKADCSTSEISLNSKITGYIYQLKDWSKIRLTFKSQKDKYSKDLQSKTIEIVLEKLYSFDIDVSFPAGLLIKKANESGLGNFSGVSMAVIAQYSFFAKDKIAQLKPFKIGAGIIALDAFDFSKASTDRDMGIVVIGTLNPVNKNRKLSFPIYLGGGYLLTQRTWFWLLGPGISVQF